MINWPEVLVGLTLGTLAGWALTHAYFVKQRKDGEPQALGINSILLALEKDGKLKLERDGAGRITGASIIEIQQSDTIRVAFTAHAATVTVTPDKPQ